jgi:SAM-dependent methyltransferase
MILQIGCGMAKIEGAVTIDNNHRVNPDILWDLDDMPWPVETGKFDFVEAVDVIEHLDKTIKVMEEIHRVLKPGGRVHIRTTAWNTEQSFRDPTHKHYNTLHTFDYFDPSTEAGSKYGFYSDCKFTIVQAFPDGQELEFLLDKI